MPEKKKSISSNKSGVKAGIALFTKMRRMPAPKFNIWAAVTIQAGKVHKAARKILPRRRDHRYGKPLSLSKQGSGGFRSRQTQQYNIGSLSVIVAQNSSRNRLYDWGRKADEIIGTIRRLLKNFKLRPYNEDTGRGFLRHVLVKRGFKSGQIMVVLVTGTRDFPKKKDFVATLLKIHPEITTVVQNVNNQKTSMVLGNRSEVLFGDGYITEQLGDFSFRISPKAFIR